MRPHDSLSSQIRLVSELRTPFSIHDSPAYFFPWGCRCGSLWLEGTKGLKQVHLWITTQKTVAQSSSQQQISCEGCWMELCLKPLRLRDYLLQKHKLILSLLSLETVVRAGPEDEASRFRELCADSLMIMRINHSSLLPKNLTSFLFNPQFRSWGPSSFFISFPHYIVQEHGSSYTCYSKKFFGKLRQLNLNICSVKISTSRKWPNPFRITHEDRASLMA